MKFSLHIVREHHSWLLLCALIPTLSDICQAKIGVHKKIVPIEHPSFLIDNNSVLFAAETFNGDTRCNNINTQNLTIFINIYCPIRLWHADRPNDEALYKSNNKPSNVYADTQSYDRLHRIIGHQQ